MWTVRPGIERAGVAGRPHRVERPRDEHHVVGSRVVERGEQGPAHVGLDPRGAPELADDLGELDRGQRARRAGRAAHHLRRVGRAQQQEQLARIAAREHADHQASFAERPRTPRRGWPRRPPRRTGCARRRGSRADRDRRPRSARASARPRTPRPRPPPRAGGRRTPPRPRARPPRSPPGARRAAGGTPRRTRRRVCAGRACARRRRARSRCTRSPRRAATSLPRVSRRTRPRAPRSVSPSTKVEPGFTMPAFSSATRAPPVTHAVGVVEAHVGEHRDRAVDDVRGVPAPEQAHLDHGGAHRLVGEPAERGSGEQLEVRRRLLEQGLEPGQVRQDRGEGVVRDRLAVPGDPLVDRLEVGAGERADLEVVGARGGP